MNYVTKPIAAQKLIESYRQNKPKVYLNRKIQFLGVDDYDVYNISKEFVYQNKLMIAGRVEKRNTEICKVAFFEKLSDYQYRIIPDADINLLQDPCVSLYNDVIVVGGTEIFVEPNTEKITSWCTSFYSGKNLETLSKVAQSPLGMKDVRFIQDGDNLHVFTRPQGVKGGLGKIGYIKLNKLSELNAENLDKATIFDNHFESDNWGGANDLHMLKNGLIGVVAHISWRSDNQFLHYYPCVFAFNPETQQSTAIKILLERQDLKDGPAKYPRLADVIFTGGLIRHENRTATLYMGTSDCEAQFAIIDDPFLEYESEVI